MNLFKPEYLGYGSWDKASPDFAKQIAIKTAKAYRAYEAREFNYAQRGGTVMKTVRRTPQFDTNYFKICDNDDPAARLGVWNTDEDLMINLLRPMTNLDAEKNITYIDFRVNDGSAVRGSTDWCAIPVFPARNKLKKCVLRYCFDFDKHYSAYRERLTPNDFALKCIRDVIYDMDGRAITNEADYQQFMMLSDMRESMYREVFAGVDNGTTSFAKGLREWFADFPADHAELDTECDWMAPVVVASDTPCATIGLVLENRMKYLREITRDMRVQGTGRTMSVNPEDFVMILSENTAECVIKCHVCQDVCGNALSLQAMNPDQLREWKFLYPSYLNGGRFGQGYIVTPNGITIDIIRSRRVLDTEMFFLYLGNASDPEGGIRLLMNDYTPYVNYIRKDGLMLDNDNPTLYGGSVVMLQSTDLCGDRYARWNWSLFDRRPYMQTHYTDINVEACVIQAVGVLPALDTATGAALNCA